MALQLGQLSCEELRSTCGSSDERWSIMQVTSHLDKATTEQGKSNPHLMCVCVASNKLPSEKLPTLIKAWTRLTFRRSPLLPLTTHWLQTTLCVPIRQYVSNMIYLTRFLQWPGQESRLEFGSVFLPSVSRHICSPWVQDISNASQCLKYQVPPHAQS